MDLSAPRPLVSIVTPSYQQAGYLEQTIQSVLSQDYPDIEYIVVDGGSTDGSVEIIQKYADRFAWWVSEPDTGQAEAINKGLLRARGEIVAWLNSDDLYRPGAVSGAVAALEADPRLGMVFGDAQTIDSEGKVLNPLRFGDWGLAQLAAFRIICQPAVFMRRSVLGQAGLLDPSYHFLLDHHLWLRIACQAPVRHVPAVWAAARHHPGAKNVAQAAQFGEEALRILSWIENRPEFAPLVRRQHRQIRAGAYRLKARYLLDGNQPGLALQAYWTALQNNPRFALEHWRRMLYAVWLRATGVNLRRG